MPSLSVSEHAIIFSGMKGCLSEGANGSLAYGFKNLGHETAVVMARVGSGACLRMDQDSISHLSGLIGENSELKASSDSRVLV